MKLIVIILAAAAAMAVAAATDADAETLSPQAGALIAATRAAPPGQLQSQPAFAPRYAGERPVRIPGVAQTAVDAKLSADDDVMGSLGFLCGLKPGAEKYGIAGARGYDDTGRFLGAKLRVAFR
ncbi:MAG: hypothetical protein JNK30_04800 [Phenylobacterium sp.]|uniref:hypothetical protein n=1 Tax=Phenylobacterium sp. TaxID=1871053 RepID=UPI001A5A4A14|nr:hypothetical protein [Phenylobacterium sp.]MBL8770679.1 hypothetical protein [Phenylobacterium sp.]